MAKTGGVLQSGHTALQAMRRDQIFLQYTACIGSVCVTFSETSYFLIVSVRHISRKVTCLLLLRSLKTLQHRSGRCGCTLVTRALHAIKACQIFCDLF